MAITGNKDQISMSHHIQNDNKDDDAIANNNSDDHCGISEIIEIVEEDDEELLLSSSSSSSSSSSRHDRKKYNNKVIADSSGLSSISEGGGGMENSTTSLFSIDIQGIIKSRGSSSRSDEDVVYVAVGKSNSSMDALLWTLNHCVKPRTTLIYLIHIFSELKFIPSPFGGGMVPKSQVSRDLVETCSAEDSRKRRQLLTKYVDKCTSHLVQVETILIESDSVANAIVELVTLLNIRRLVVGISKSNLRKVKVGKRSAIVAYQIKQRVSPGCELEVICQGKQLNMSEYFGNVGVGGGHLLYNFSSSPAATSSGCTTQYKQQPPQPPTIAYNTPFSCCFKANTPSTLP